MEHVLFVKAINVFTRYHIDLAVPVMVQGFECCKLLQLFWREVGKVFLKNVHGAKIKNQPPVPRWGNLGRKDFV
jgi:hypothetical protein